MGGIGQPTLSEELAEPTLPSLLPLRALYNRIVAAKGERTILRQTEKGVTTTKMRVARVR